MKLICVPTHYCLSILFNAVKLSIIFKLFHMCARYIDLSLLNYTFLQELTFMTFYVDIETYFIDEVS